MVRKLGGEVVELYCDSQLVFGQVNREFEARDERVQGYLSRVKCALNSFKSFIVKQIPRGHNAHADSLGMLATYLGSKLPWVVLVEDMINSSLPSTSTVGIHSIQVGPSWMDPIVTFSKQVILPENKTGVERKPLKITQKNVTSVKGMRQNIHQLGGVLNPLSSPWPFSRWGLDIVGHRRWLIVGTNYFTKWVEAEPLANIRDVDAKRFIWKNIVTHFGVPHTLISDNGFQFDSKAFRRYCGDLGIRNGYSTPAYPQGNGQVEATNKVILARLKKRLDDAKERWVEELAHVLWTYRITPRRSTGETPFSMTCRMEAVIPLELGFPTLKSKQYSFEGNHRMLLDNFDTVEERREVASVKMANYQQKLKKTYDKGVKLRPLMPGDLVLKKIVGTAKNPAWGKM
ncbi:uncharacterized protein LOC142644139 [Castanea sativa]|uniref:uncharacterized protein LOC142644139 n=1 Tax=Castanea sativa TaxID=21020 RepID=UPI003F6535CD